MATVSVIIPVYNTEEYLEACLTSVRSQTFDDFEAIIVNDGSTDKSASIIDKFVQDDSRFRSFYQDNAGPSEARNTGIRQASSPWITFVDSDDMIDPKFLEILLNGTQNSDADIICCQKKTFYNTPKYQTFNSVQHKIISGREACINALYQNDRPDYSAWNKLYQKGIWETRRFPAGKFFEDMATIPGILFDSKKIVLIPRSLYYYRKRETGILSTTYDRKKAEILDIAEDVYTQVKDKSSQLKKAAESNLFSASCSILIRSADSKEFKDYRDRAWNWVKKFRIQTLLDSKCRIRNKIAAITSFLPTKLSQKIFKRGVR